MKHSLKHRSAGFTVIELIVVIVLVGVASVLFYMQKTNLDTANRDEKRKIAVNAIYYNLEEVFYPKNSFYPQTINKANLPAVDPDLLIDTNGVDPSQKVDESLELTDDEKKTLETIVNGAYEYRYEPSNCDTEGKCKSYTLRVSLNNEAEYVKKSRHK
jgi:prepilin-type N-terminal cleavage/methylation domain-containing protein